MKSPIRCLGSSIFWTYSTLVTLLLVTSSVVHAIPPMFMSSSSSLTSQAISNLKLQLQLRPNLVNGVVGMMLFGGSDIFAQQLEKARNNNTTTKKKKNESRLGSIMVEIDFRRFFSAAVTGACFGGAIYPFAYRRLDGIVQGTNLIAVCKKSVLEIFTLGVFANAVSMTSRGILKGRDPRDVLSHVTKQIPKVTLHDFGVWFPYNMFLFGLVPISARPAATSLMDTCWQTYISLQSNDYDNDNKEKKVADATDAKIATTDDNKPSSSNNKTTSRTRSLRAAIMPLLS